MEAAALVGQAAQAGVMLVMLVVEMAAVVGYMAVPMVALRVDG